MVSDSGGLFGRRADRPALPNSDAEMAILMALLAGAVIGWCFASMFTVSYDEGRKCPKCGAWQ